jgi:hypothetical protein
MGNEVYPHRLSLLGSNICDICKSNREINFYRLRFNPYIGMISCGNKTCIDIINNSIEKNIKKLDNLIETYGKWIYVIRSNGKKESNWNICSDAYREKENGDFWVEVKHGTKNKTKTIKLSNITEWNE